MLDSLQQLIESYGYAALLVGTFFEGETVLILGGVAARLGYLKLEWVIVCAFVGSLLGDQFWFLIGRRYGRQLLVRHASWQPRVERIHTMLERFETPVLVGFRFLYGVRNLTPFVVGMSRIPPTRFLALNATGALLWALVGALLGYAFTHAADAMLGNIKRFELELLALVIVLGIGAWGIRHLRQRRIARRRFATADDEVRPPARTRNTPW